MHKNPGCAENQRAAQLRGSWAVLREQGRGKEAYFRGPRRIRTGSGRPKRSSAHGSPRMW